MRFSLYSLLASLKEELENIEDLRELIPKAARMYEYVVTLISNLYYLLYDFPQKSIEKYIESVFYGHFLENREKNLKKFLDRRLQGSKEVERINSNIIRLLRNLRNVYSHYINEKAQISELMKVFHEEIEEDLYDKIHSSFIDVLEFLKEASKGIFLTKDSVVLSEGGIEKKVVEYQYLFKFCDEVQEIGYLTSKFTKSKRKDVIYITWTGYCEGEVPYLSDIFKVYLVESPRTIYYTDENIKIDIESKINGVLNLTKIVGEDSEEAIKSFEINGVKDGKSEIFEMELGRLPEGAYNLIFESISPQKKTRFLGGFRVEQKREGPLKIDYMGIDKIVEGKERFVEVRISNFGNVLKHYRVNLENHDSIFSIEGLPQDITIDPEIISRKVVFKVSVKRRKYPGKRDYRLGEIVIIDLEKNQEVLREDLGLVSIVKGFEPLQFLDREIIVNEFRYNRFRRKTQGIKVYWIEGVAGAGKTRLSKYLKSLAKDSGYDVYDLDKGSQLKELFKKVGVQIDEKMGQSITMGISLSTVQDLPISSKMKLTQEKNIFDDFLIKLLSKGDERIYVSIDNAHLMDVMDAKGLIMAMKKRASTIKKDVIFVFFSRTPWGLGKDEVNKDTYEEFRKFLREEATDSNVSLLRRSYTLTEIPKEFPENREENTIEVKDKEKIVELILEDIFPDIEVAEE